MNIGGKKMAKMKVAIIGSGNRSKEYIQSIKVLSDQFELVSMRFRTQEKADLFAKTFDIPVTTSVDELLAAKPDFVIVAVNRLEGADVEVCAAMVAIEEILKAGVPVLAETPPAEKPGELTKLWNLTQSLNSKMLVAENYWAEPMFAAKLEAAKSGMLGDIQTVTVSNTHQYHATSVIRMFEQVTIVGRKFVLPLTVTENKYGQPFFEGKTTDVDRTHVMMEFANNKYGIYDFAIAQYWSTIRSNYFMVQGSRGEIKDNDIWYMDKQNNVLRGRFDMITTSSGELVSIGVGDRILYKNPFVGTGIRSIGPASVLLNMKEYLETGKAKYTFANGMQDTYDMMLILEAENNPYKKIVSTPQPWQV
jgi:predicted dehydrogenase